MILATNGIVYNCEHRRGGRAFSNAHFLSRSSVKGASAGNAHFTLSCCAIDSKLKHQIYFRTNLNPSCSDDPFYCLHEIIINFMGIV